MVIEVTDLGETLTTDGTTFHYGVVTIKGNPYDFSVCEMYDENANHSEFEVSVLEYDGDEEIDEDEIIEEVLEVQNIRNMSDEELREVALAQREQIKHLEKGVETSAMWPHEEDERYLGETKDFVYFNDEAYNAAVMYRKSDNKKFQVEDIVNPELIKDVLNGEFIKIAPSFIYDYQEILKEHDDV